MLIITVALLGILPGYAFSLEVSEVTVDFPLSEVLDLEQAPTDQTEQVGEQVRPQTSIWRAPWEEDWFAYRQSVLKGNFDDADKSIKKIISYRQARGIPNLYLPAAALLIESSQARRQERYGDAQNLITYAKQLAPDDPAPHFQKARTIWSQNQLRVLSAVDSVLEGYGLFFKDFRYFFPGILGLLLWVLTAFVVASILTVFLFVPRIFPRLAHDLSHRVKIPPTILFAVIILLLCAMLLLGMPFMMWILVIAILMIGHMTNRERVAVATAILFMVFIPVLVHIMALSHSFHSDSAPLVLYQADRGGEGPPSVEQLHKLQVEKPDDPRIPAAMAVVHKRAGQLRDAESMLIAALEITPDSPAFNNNLANVFLHNRRIERAIVQYQRALRYSDDPRIHYNLSQALRDNLQLEEGEKEYRIAQEKAPELISLLGSQQKEGERRVTVDISGDLSGYVKDALQLSGKGLVWRDRFWAGMLPGVPYTFAWLVFLAASLLLLAGWPIGKRENFSRRCKKCSRLHCSKCSQSTADVLCAQCRQIFMVRTGIDPASRVKKMMQILRYQKKRGFISIVSTILVPGMGHVYLGAGWRALLMITITTLFWTKWALWNGLFRNTTMLEIQAGLTAKIIFGVLFFAYYIIALRSIGIRLEEN